MIFELLDTGEQNARTARELARLLHVDRRSVSVLVERERRAGKPICATSDSKTPGYYIPATREDMERYCGRLKHRAGEIFKTRAACLATLDSLPAGVESEAPAPAALHRRRRGARQAAPDKHDPRPGTQRKRTDFTREGGLDGGQIRL